MGDRARTDRGRSVPRPHVVAVCGSRRDGSYTRRALLEALSGASAAGATTELLDLAALSLPPLDPDPDEPGDGEGANRDADAMRRTVRDADATVLGTPVYHGSYAGGLKNALDYCGFEEFERTTVGLLAVSGGPFPSSALDHLRIVCRSLHARVIPYQAAIPRASDAFDGDEFVDEELRARVRELGARTVADATGASEVVRAERLLAADRGT